MDFIITLIFPLQTYFQTVQTDVYPYAQPVIPSTATKDLVTGIKVKVLGSAPSYLTSVNFYDKKGRLLQSRSQNISSAVDVLSFQYNWIGQPIVQILQHQKSAPVPHTATVATKFCYDDLGRLSKTEKKIASSLVNAGTAPTSWTTISLIEFDELGQVKARQLGNKPGQVSIPLTVMEYTYNIHGWLTSLNKDYLGNSNNDQYFGMELSYDKNGSQGSFETPQYNGNVAGIVWKNESDQKKRKYEFSYDVVNRLTEAVFGEYVSGSGAASLYNTSGGVDFSISDLSYDLNGNILTKKQNGWKLSGSTTIDNLSYTYEENSNRLKNVIDESNDPLTKLGDFRSSQSYLNSIGGVKSNTTTDFHYDANGNLVKDLNKDIENSGNNGILYNHLNLPEKIYVSNKGYIEFTYDALGNKLEKKITETGTGAQTNTFLYASGFEYKNDTLVQVAQEEGRIRYEKSSGNNCPALNDRFIYDYYIKDHLGNVRVLLTEEERSDCYIAATLENGRLLDEKRLYSITDSRIVNKTGAGASQTSLEEKIYRVHGGINEKTGLGITIKVMSGDKVSIRAESFYNLPSGGPGSPLQMGLTELLTSLIANESVITKGILSTSDISDIPGNSVALSTFLASNSPGTNTPKAALNWILFDEHFKFVSGNFDNVSSGGGYKNHVKFISNPVNVTKSGYLYIYVSNESNLPVYFDNLQLTHTRGAILETSDYYPFGMAMTGINTRALNGVAENTKNRFNNAELTDDLSLNTYSFFYRNYDPQLGRWWQSDPKPTEMFSTYSSMNNNPISNTDPMGDTTYYYTSDGKLRYTSNDKLENAIVVIPVENEEAFFAHFVNNYIYKPEKMNDEEAMNTDLRRFGAGYSTDEYFAYYDQNSKDYYKGGDANNGTKDIFKPIDGKGKLINEHAAATILKDGFVRIFPGTDDSGNPTISSPKVGSKGMVHTHTNEGRRVAILQNDGTYKSATISSGKAGLDVDLQSTLYTDASKGNFRIVVTPTHMYLYADGKVMISIDRKLTPSQKPEDIK